MMNKIVLSLLAISFMCCNVGANEKKVPLNGNWSFAFDRKDKGEQEKWYNSSFNECVVFPGSLTTNGKGDNISSNTPWTGQIVDSSWFKSEKYAKYRVPGNVKIAAWLQPTKYYKGAAWYSRDIEITNELVGKPLEVCFERVHWESTLWIDSTKIGTLNSLGTPHRYVLKPLSKGTHKLTLRIDNRLKDINVGHNAHSVSDHTQSNWNGVVGDLFFRTLGDVVFENVLLYPDIEKRTVRVVVITNNYTQSAKNLDLIVTVKSKNTPKLSLPAPNRISMIANVGIDTTTVEYNMGENIFLWSEFTPYLYEMNLHLTDKTFSENRNIQFGMRKLNVQGKRFHLNDRPIFLRGTLECAIFPKTGYPATDEATWARIFEICKAHGLNHVRFHSWCPPHAAFYAADRLGVYLQVEGGGWCNVGDNTPFDKWIYEESDRIMKEYGNHPSFMFYTYGNEPGGENQSRFLGDLVNYLKAKDTRHLYTSAAGWPNIEDNQYRNDMYPRLKVWGAPSPLNEKPVYNHNFDKMVSECAIPWVSHEIRQWCVYPDFKEISKYDDAVLQAKNFEIFRETLAENGLSDYAEPFLLASGKLQTLLYKAEIEAALRTKDFAGFQLLDLHDFPGQGTALVGVLNPFWESKGYVTPGDYHRFSSSIVPLVRTDKVLYKNSEMMKVEVEIANFGEKPLEGVVPHWTLTKSDGSIFATGNFEKQNIALDNCIKLGTIEYPLSFIVKPEKLVLTVTVSGNSNTWDFWVYPTYSTQLEDVKVVNKLDGTILKKLEAGAKVLLMPDSGALKKEFGGDVQTGFSSIFWNSAWTARQQPPLTLGLLNQDKHPIFTQFPTEYHSNYQWYDVVTGANVVNLTALKSNIQPLTRVIDDWFENRSLGLIFEANVGNGKLVYVGKNLKNQDIASTALYNSIVNYMNSDKFSPKGDISSVELTGIFNN